VAEVPRYDGPFGAQQAERLLWRAAFGGTRGKARSLAEKGLKGAVRSLTRPQDQRLRGPKPTDGEHPIAPYDLWGHDVLWALDRMVRSRAPALERMALIWHDWFATGDVSSAELSIGQWRLFRELALGSFEDLLLAVTRDPAMLVWLSGVDNQKGWPNENYARELMELFTLGAAVDGYPYSEDDVREQARALTGWTARWQDDVGYVDFHYEERRHDNGAKTVFGRSGNFDWRDSCRLCLEHEAHAPYFVGRMWAHFIPEPPDPATQAALEERYVGSGHAIRPVVEAILMHPRLYEGPAMVKPPAVAIAGMLRARKRPVDTDSWAWISDLAGQRIFRPPNVSGWDETRWLDTSTFRGRWEAAHHVAEPEAVPVDESYPANETPQEALDAARSYWGQPTLTQATVDALLGFGEAVEATTPPWGRNEYRAMRQNALRMLIASSPDYQAC
jgi:uncharacterized protein (DUF1800 family)